MHNKFNVSANVNFYNKSNQKVVKFSTCDHIKVFINGITTIVHKNDFDAVTMVPCNKNMVVAVDKMNGNKLLIHTTEFNKNKERYMGHTAGYKYFVNINTAKVEKFKLEDIVDKTQYRHFNTGRVATIQTKDKLKSQRIKTITAKNYDGEIKRLRIDSQEIITGEFNQLNALKIIIEDEHKNIICKTVSIRKVLINMQFTQSQIKSILYKLRTYGHAKINSINIMRVA